MPIPSGMFDESSALLIYICGFVLYRGMPVWVYYGTGHLMVIHRKKNRSTIINYGLMNALQLADACNENSEFNRCNTGNDHTNDHYRPLDLFGPLHTLLPSKKKRELKESNKTSKDFHVHTHRSLKINCLHSEPVSKAKKITKNYSSFGFGFFFLFSKAPSLTPMIGNAVMSSGEGVRVLR